MRDIGGRIIQIGFCLFFSLVGLHYVFAQTPQTSVAAETSIPDQSQTKQKPDPIRISGNALLSKLIKRVQPEYPESAKREEVEGKVILQVMVDEEGNVCSAKVTKGHPLLDDAAIAAVKKWKYSATQLNGEPIRVVSTVTIVFSLKSKPNSLQ